MEKIFFNGSIITMEDADLNNPPEAVLIKNNLIKYVGTLTEAKKMVSVNAEIIDLDGKCLMPAFIDSHSHIVMNGQMSICADLSACESYDDIINTLKEYIENNNIKTDGYVIGFGYDHNFLKENDHPDKRILDQVSNIIPIMVMHISGHLCCVNSAIIEMSGIPIDTENPNGGVFGRMPDSTEINGFAEETAMIPFQQVLENIIKLDIESIMRNMQKVYLENGITTVQDGATGKKEFQILETMSKKGMLKVDVIVYPVMNQEGTELMHKYGEKYHNYNNHLKIGGYKMILDGSPQGRTAWMSEPYLAGEENYCGYPWMGTKTFEKNIHQALIEKKQLLVHCNGDNASQQYLDVYEKQLKETNIKNDLRPVMIHCQTVRNDQLNRMAKIKMIASFFIGHVWYWGDVHVKNLGKKRGSHISPLKDALDYGVIFNFHQDTPVTKPDMIHSVWCAVNRISRSGKTIGEDQKIDVYESLKAVTINAAFEYHEENIKGSIKCGKYADLVILDKSPLLVDKVNIKNIKILETIKYGKTVYKQ